jgi:outer membrane protein TolC
MLREYSSVFRSCAYVIVGLFFSQISAFANADMGGLNRFDLKAFYDSAWERQPESKTFQYKIDSAIAKQKVASSFLASPASIEFSQKTDKANNNLGTSETVIGLGFPLWLWNERSSSVNLANAEYKKLMSQYYLSQLKVAAEVRDAYWSYQKTKLENDLAHSRFENTKTLAIDVEKRFKVGDLARADLHQANGALATAESNLAEQRIKTLLGTEKFQKIKLDIVSKNTEPLPKVPESLSSLDASLPIVIALINQLDVAKRAVELVRSKTRTSPELQILSSKGREVYGAPYQQSITVGIKIPFGSSAVNADRLASATAEMVDSEIKLAYERESALSNVESNVTLVKSAQIKLDAANKRSTLANETRQFFDKSFRYGETDLPTRLRIELEAVDANKQAVIAKINYAISVSNLRQALGLLPE